MYLPLTIMAVIAIALNSVFPHRWSAQLNLAMCAIIVVDFYLI